MGLYSEKKYHEALDVAREARARFPHFEEKTSFWIACLLSRLGQYDDSVWILVNAVEHGIWWPDQSLEDPDLEGIRTRPEFEVVRAECNRLRLEQSKQAAPDLMVRLPSGAPGPTGWPALMVFHQRYGEHPELSSAPWVPAMSKGMLLAAPWSSQVYASDGRCWDDPDLADRDLKWAFSKLSAMHSVDLNKMVLAGLSQGAALSIFAAMKKIIPCRGFVAVAPSDWVVPEESAVKRKQPSAAFTSMVERGDFRGLRGAIIIGEEDNFLPKIKPIYELMLKRGLQGRFVVEPHLGHDYPEMFENKLLSAIDYVLG